MGAEVPQPVMSRSHCIWKCCLGGPQRWWRRAGHEMVLLSVALVVVGSVIEEQLGRCCGELEEVVERKKMDCDLAETKGTHFVGRNGGRTDHGSGSSHLLPEADRSRDRLLRTLVRHIAVVEADDEGGAEVRNGYVVQVLAVLVGL